ncbi:MAG: hypothetical protein U0269_32485 [Polyangiales bacterium]
MSATSADAATSADSAASRDVTPPTPVSCQAGQWCWQSPLPQGNPLNGVHIVSARDAWAVGDRGAIVHFDGERWSQVPSPTDVDLHTMWGSGPADVWAYGLRTRSDAPLRYALIRWNGSQWQRVEHGALPYIRDLHGSGEDNLWLVTAGSDSTSALSRWNGAAFVPAPALPDNARPQSVCARSRTEVWVTAADPRTSWPTMLYRWDGVAWTLAHRTDIARGERLNSGVVCPADGVAIVTHFDFESGVETYLEVRDGRVGGDSLPLPVRTAPRLLRTPHGAVYYANATDAVEWTPNGWQRRFGLVGVEPLALSFDHLPDRSAGFLVHDSPFVSTLRGAQWTTDPNEVRSVLRLVISADPTRNSDPVAAFGVGTWARPSGEGWSYSAPPTLENGALFSPLAAWGASAERRWLVGERGAIALYDARAQSITPAPIAEPINDTLLAVDGSGAAAWAVGGNGAVLRWDGARWARPSVPLPREVDGLPLTTLELTAVDVISDNDVMILGNDPLGGRFGSIFFRWNGARWSTSITFGASLTLFDRDARGNVYVVTEGTLEKRPAAGGAPTLLARPSSRIARLRVYGEDELEVVLSDEAGLTLATWDQDRRELRVRTGVLSAVGATNIVPGGSDAQGRATYWAVGASGSVLRYVTTN